MLCAWCEETATWVLVADADLAHHDHPACDEHRTTWAHLYRRAVSVSPNLVVDVRDLEPGPDGAPDAEAAEAAETHAVDLRMAEEPIGRHER